MSMLSLLLIEELYIVQYSYGFIILNPYGKTWNDGIPLQTTLWMNVTCNEHHRWNKTQYLVWMIYDWKTILSFKTMLSLHIVSTTLFLPSRFHRRTGKKMVEKSQPFGRSTKNQLGQQPGNREFRRAMDSPERWDCPRPIVIQKWRVK